MKKWTWLKHRDVFIKRYEKATSERDKVFAGKAIEHIDDTIKFVEIFNLGKSSHKYYELSL